MSGWLIVNADDFGLHPRINDGIAKLFEQGALSSTSMLVGGKAAEQGLESLDSKFHSRIGVHLCFDEERPISSPDRIPHLIGERGRLKSRGAILTDVALGKVPSEELEREIIAQIERFLAFGLVPNHIDGHGHLHVFPPIARAIRSATQRLGIACPVRIPKEPRLIRRGLSGGYLSRLPVSLMITFFASYAKRNGFKDLARAEKFLGLLESGHISADDVGRLIASISRENQDAEAIEVMCHPGLATPSEIPEYAHWQYDWRLEYEAIALLAQNLPVDAIAT